jgi:nucleoside-diphosphate kinase
MTIEYTLSIIKPDAVQRYLIGKILDRFESNGLYIVNAKMTKLTKAQAQKFYAIHRDKPFYDSLTDYMSSGPIMVQILKGESAVEKNREIMGATDPQKAKKGTIRADFAQSIEENSVHGSDSLSNAKMEIEFFFEKAQSYDIDL